MIETPNRFVATLTAVALLILPMGCAARSPLPELYPNEHLRKVGEAQARQDIAYCQALSQQYVQQKDAGREVAVNTVGGTAGGAAVGAIGGAIGGNAGKGAAIGAGVGAGLGLIRGLAKGSEPPKNYEAFVRKCLSDKGYEVLGFTN